MEKMSITRALAEVKLLDKRIEKTISQANLVSFAKNSSKDVDKNVSKEEYCKSAKSTLQSINDLIDRRCRILTSISISNASHEIEVAGKKYKVVEAITRKNNIDYEKDLLSKIGYQLIDAKYKVDTKNEVVNNKLQEMLVTMMGRENAKNMTDEASRMSEQYLKDNEYGIVDGIGAEKLVKSMEEEIDSFLFEIDFALSSHNSLTEIEI